jgi:hypothetical protein
VCTIKKDDEIIGFEKKKLDVLGKERALKEDDDLTFSRLMTYTGCNRRNGPDFGRVFLMLKYTDITQITYVQS